MFMEIWKDIPDYEGLYQISNLGNVKSLKCNKEKILKPHPNTNGYLMVGLSKEKCVKTRTVHQLMAITFLDHKPCGFKFVVNHKNFNRLYNRLINLEVVTMRENTNFKHIKSSSNLIGASKHTRLNRWVSAISINGKTKYLGLYKTEIEAHETYKKALKELIYSTKT